MKRQQFLTNQEALELILTKSDSEEEVFSSSEGEDEHIPHQRDKSPQPSSSAGITPGPSRIQFVEESSESESDSSDDEDSENTNKKRKCDTLEWSSNNLSPTNHPFNYAQSGCKANVNNGSPIIDFFLLFFDVSLMTFIADECNRYYNYVVENMPHILQSHSRIKQWKDTDYEELFCFLAVCLLMARVKKLKLSEYWSKDALLRTPVFGEVMSRDRFLLLLRMLHFCDNSVDNGGDRLFKIRGIVDRIRNTFQNSFVPYRKLCIDESLLLFKGRLIFKQYIPSKRSRFGIKTFVICDCQTGYVLDFVVYTGAKSDIDEVGLGKSGDIVATLLKSYLNKGHTVYLDNWYSSPQLFLWLHTRTTNACGTVRKNRKNMPKIDNKLKKGEISFRSSGELLAMKWCDKREVWMLSTCHSADMAESEKTDRKSGNKILKPTCILDYNKNMGSVDRTDMVISSIESVRKTVKWYKKLFFHVLDLAVLNAHSLHTTVTGTKLPLATFHLMLIREILEKFAKQRRRSGGGRRSDEDTPMRLSQRHFPAIIEAAGVKKFPTRKCIVCTKHKIRRETRYWCRDCEVSLCVTPCFENYHTKKNF